MSARTWGFKSPLAHHCRYRPPPGRDPVVPGGCPPSAVCSPLVVMGDRLVAVPRTAPPGLPPLFAYPWRHGTARPDQGPAPVATTLFNDHLSPSRPALRPGAERESRLPAFSGPDHLWALRPLGRRHSCRCLGRAPPALPFPEQDPSQASTREPRGCPCPSIYVPDAVAGSAPVSVRAGVGCLMTLPDPNEVLPRRRRPPK